MRKLTKLTKRLRYKLSQITFLKKYLHLMIIKTSTKHLSSLLVIKNNNIIYKCERLSLRNYIKNRKYLFLNYLHN